MEYTKKYNKEHYIQKKIYLKPNENEKVTKVLEKENLSLKKFVIKQTEIVLNQIKKEV